MDKLSWDQLLDIPNTRQICAKHTIPLDFVLMDHGVISFTIWMKSPMTLKTAKVNNNHQHPSSTKILLLHPSHPIKSLEVGRIISAINKLPSEDQPQQQQQKQQQQIKPLPMFDTVRNNNNQQQKQQQQSSQRGNNFYPNPSGWNPLNSNSFGLNVDQKQAPRLPVFSTLSK